MKTREQIEKEVLERMKVNREMVAGFERSLGKLLISGADLEKDLVKNEIGKAVKACNALQKENDLLKWFIDLLRNEKQIKKPQPKPKQKNKAEPKIEVETSVGTEFSNE